MERMVKSPAHSVTVGQKDLLIPPATQKGEPSILFVRLFRQSPVHAGSAQEKRAFQKQKRQPRRQNPHPLTMTAPLINKEPGRNETDHSEKREHGFALPAYSPRKPTPRRTCRWA